MAWNDLKATVAAVIRTNGNQEITGALLQSTLNSIIDQVGANATFKGVAIPTTNPGVPDGPLFYIAYEKGIYANFNAINITEEDGLVIILYSSNWNKINIPLALKDELVQVRSDFSEAITSIEQEQIRGGVYDVSSHNDGAVFESLSDLLNNANLSTLIPTSVRCGGMSIRFIQSSVQNSDNKYVQARCMAQNFTTDVTQWQGVDDEPTAGSDNLVKSGGTYLLNQRINTNKINIDKLDYPSTSYLFRSNNTTLVPCALEAGEYIFKNNSAIGLVVTLVDAEENAICVIDGNGTPSGSSKSFELPSDCVFAKIWVLNSSGTSISLAFTISIGNNLEKRVSQNTENTAKISIITKNVFGAFANDITDFSTFDTYPVVIKNDKYWVGTGESVVIPIVGGTKIKLYPTVNGWSYAVFLKTLGTIKEGSMADVCDSDEYNDGYRLSTSANQVVELNIPDDCNYFVIQTKRGSIDTTPIKILSISGDLYDYDKRLDVIENSFITESEIDSEQVQILSVNALTLGSNGLSQAIDVTGYNKCKLQFTTAIYTGGGFCALGLVEYDEDGHILNSILPDTSNNGGLLFVKEDGTTTNQVNTGSFPNGGYCIVSLKNETATIKLRAFVNSSGQALNERVPQGWSFGGIESMYPLHRAAIINSGISVDDLISVEDVVFEQGSIVFNTGVNTPSSDYIRTGYLDVDDYQYVRCENKHILRVFYYDESYNYISQITSIFFSQIQEIKFDGAKYFRVSIKYPNITPNSSFYFHITKRLTKDAFESIYADGIARLGSLFKANEALQFLDVTDLHGMFQALDLCNDIKKLFSDDIKIICTGDVLYVTPRVNNVDDPALDVFLQKMQEYGVYFCVGQHEVGFQNLSAGIDGKLISRCLTHQEVFEYFIEPMKSFYGLPNDYNNIWYKVDFGSTAKTMLISLYQWNVPLDIDPNDNTKYKYIRSTQWYGQDQIDWFINTLNSVPSGYHIIVLLHAIESNIIDYDGNPFYGPRASGTMVTDGCPVMDIIDAYISRTTIDKTYTATHSPDPTHDTTDYTDLTLTAVGDFTNAVGNFGFYLCGDIHADSFGKLEDAVNTQLVLCNGSPNGTIASDKDLIGVGNDTFVTGFNVNDRFDTLRVGRMGNTESWFMQDRSRATISLP